MRVTRDVHVVGRSPNTFVFFSSSSATARELRGEHGRVSLFFRLGRVLRAGRHHLDLLHLLPLRLVSVVTLGGFIRRISLRISSLL